MLLITCWLLSILSGQMSSLSWCSAITFFKVSLISSFLFSWSTLMSSLSCWEMFAIILSNLLSRSYSKSFSQGFGNFGRRHVLVFHVLLSALGLGHLEFLVLGFWFCFLFWGLFCFCCCSSIFLLSVAVFTMFRRRSSNNRVEVLFSSVGPAFRATDPDLVSPPPRKSTTVCNDSYQCQPCFHCSWWPPCD